MTDISREIELLKTVSTTVVYDVLAYMGLREQSLSSEIAPLDPTVQFVGQALTVRGTSSLQWNQELGSALSYEMFDRITPGTVIVIDTDGNNVSGPWGANTGRGALIRGAVATVIDGGTRDRRDLIEMNLPVFCRFVTPVLSHGHWEVREVGSEILVSGQSSPKVRVRTGDVLHGNSDGICVIPLELVGLVAPAAVAAEEVESQIQNRLRTGEDRRQIDQSLDRWSYLKKQGLYVESALRMGAPVIAQEAAR